MGTKGEKIDFKIDCSQRCRDLEIVVTHSTGDIDLYGEVDDIPHLVSVDVHVQHYRVVRGVSFVGTTTVIAVLCVSHGAPPSRTNAPFPS